MFHSQRYILFFKIPSSIPQNASYFTLLERYKTTNARPIPVSFLLVVVTKLTLHVKWPNPNSGIKELLAIFTS